MYGVQLIAMRLGLRSWLYVLHAQDILIRVWSYIGVSLLQGKRGDIKMSYWDPWKKYYKNIYGSSDDLENSIVEQLLVKQRIFQNQNKWTISYIIIVDLLIYYPNIPFV